MFYIRLVKSMIEIYPIYSIPRYYWEIQAFASDSTYQKLFLKSILKSDSVSSSFGSEGHILAFKLKYRKVTIYTPGLLSISLFYNHYHYHCFTKISITLPLPLQFKNHTINYITIIIKTTLITITITLASILHYITISTKSHVTDIF